MKINLSSTEKTGKIRKVFNTAFPFLKIEFFNTSHVAGQPSANKNLVREDISLGELNPAIKEDVIILKPGDRVASLEQQFQEQFGLSIQVFRKQKNVWIETTRTDQLTLAEQNEKGKLVSAPAIHSEPGDRYLEDGQF